MSDIKLMLHIPGYQIKSMYVDPNRRIADQLREEFSHRGLVKDPGECIIQKNNGPAVSFNDTFQKAGFKTGDEVHVKLTTNFSSPGWVVSPRTYHQLGILVLDGSYSMLNMGSSNLCLADHVDKAVKGLIKDFKVLYTRKDHLSLAVITFDNTAAVHTQPTPLKQMDELADYNPTNGHGGHTDIGVALDLAEQLALAHLNGKEADNIECPVSIILMSDGMCLNPDYTRQVVARIKGHTSRKKTSLQICTTYFKGNYTSIPENKKSEEEAQHLLQEIASRPDLYTVSYDYEHLTKFFVGSLQSIT